jgi:hypothetical protein
MGVVGIHQAQLLHLLLVVLAAGHLAVTYSQRLYLARREHPAKVLLVVILTRLARAELLLAVADQAQLAVLQQYQIPLVMAAQAQPQALRVRLLLMRVAAAAVSILLTLLVPVELVVAVPVIRTAELQQAVRLILVAAAAAAAQMEQLPVMAVMVAPALLFCQFRPRFILE